MICPYLTAEKKEISWGVYQLVFTPMVGVFTKAGVGESPNAEGAQLVKPWAAGLRHVCHIAAVAQLNPILVTSRYERK